MLLGFGLLALVVWGYYDDAKLKKAMEAFDDLFYLKMKLRELRGRTDNLAEWQPLCKFADLRFEKLCVSKLPELAGTKRAQELLEDLLYS